MAPALLADLQERILDACKAAGHAAAGKTPTDRELADVAGVDASIVSRGAGERHFLLGQRLRQRRRHRVLNRR